MENKFIKWLEIPVADMKRARKFYETILDISLIDINVGGEIYPCFPGETGEEFNGALVKYDFTQPGNKGPLIYLNANPEISSMLKK